MASTDSIWLPLALGWLEKRFRWPEFAALRTPGCPSGSIWLLEKRGPLQRNFDFAAQGQCFVDVALVASIWVLCALLGAPAGSIWLPTTALLTRLANYRFAYRRSCFDAACFVRSGTFLHASNLVYDILQY